MKKSKLRSDLLSKLAASASDELMEVILELDKPQVKPGGSRQERIALLKESFARTSAPVTRAVSELGGEVLGAAWINQTILARLNPEGVRRMTELDSVSAVDLPHDITAESF
jgi:hypothetical protein